MIREYATIPPSMAGTETYGFSWMDFVTAIPSPLFVATSYKSNGKPNACLQSWACFNGSPRGFYAILSSVSKAGHLYRTIREKGVVVLNFPSADIWSQCLETIRNNGFDDDEIALSGLTAGPAVAVDAPRIRECFLFLECRQAWEREWAEGDGHVLMCLEVVHIGMEEARLDETDRGRYGEGGYLYNVHHPVNPESFGGKAHDYLAVLQKIRDMGEY